MVGIQTDLDYFVHPLAYVMPEDEYPETQDASPF